MHGNVHIRAMKEADLPAVFAIEQQVFSVPWSPASFLYELLNNPHTDLIVAEVWEQGTAQLAGYCVWWVLAGEAQIGNVAVDPTFQHQGVGHLLLEAVLKKLEDVDADRVMLDVRVSNTAALRLYQSFGFEEVGRRRGYYTKPVEDAILMTRFLQTDGREESGEPKGKPGCN